MRFRRAAAAAGSTFTLSVLPEVSTAVTFEDSLKAMPCFCSMRWNCLRDFAIDAGQDVVEEFDDRHLGAEPPPHRAELEPDDAGADDEKLLRHLGEIERAGRGHDALLVDVDAVQPRDVGAGGDDDVLGLQRLRLAVVGFHLDLAGRGDAAGAVKRLDLVLLEQIIDAFDVAVDALLLVFEHRGEIDARLADLDAHLARICARPPHKAPTR